VTSVRYYGRKFGEENFTGRLGKLVCGLNRARTLVERATEVAVAVHEARKEGEPLKPILRQMLKEGFQPMDIVSRGPISLQLMQGEDSEFSSRFYNSRDYTARVGRTKRQTSLEAIRDTNVREDATLSLFARYGLQRSHRSKHGMPPVIIENFQAVTEDEQAS